MIVLKKICKKYGRKVIYDNFSLTINDGEFVAIVGASGSGKSTLLNIIGLLEPVDKGRVSIDDQSDITPQSNKAISIIRYKFNYLFQNYALIDEETVEYNLKLALRFTKGNKKELIKNALKRVGLGGYEKAKIYQLSGGEQQRVALARVILKPSKYILADEPTGSLDPNNRDIVIRTLRKLNREDNKTVIIVTHDMYVADQCDRIIEIG
jgi:putative ABC transport system ATP-binding protein